MKKMNIPMISSIEERIMEANMVKETGIVPGSYEEAIRNCQDSNISEMKCPNSIITRIPLAPMKNDAYLMENAKLHVQFAVGPANFFMASTVVGAAAHTYYTDILLGWETAGMIFNENVKLLIDNSEVYTLHNGSAAAISKLVWASLSGEVTKHNKSCINIESIQKGLPMPYCMKRIPVKRVANQAAGLWGTNATGTAFSAEDLTFDFYVDMNQWLPVFEAMNFPITRSVGNLSLQLEIKNPLSSMVWAVDNKFNSSINFVPIDKPLNVTVIDVDDAVLGAVPISATVGLQSTNAAVLPAADGTVAKVSTLWNVSAQSAWEFKECRLIQTTFKLTNPQGIEALMQRGMRLPITHITDHTFNSGTNIAYGDGASITLETKINAYAVKALVVTFPYKREFRHWLPNPEFTDWVASYGGVQLQQEAWKSINDARAVNQFLNAFTDTDKFESNPNYLCSLNKPAPFDLNLFAATSLLGNAVAVIASLNSKLTRHTVKYVLPNAAFLPIDFAMLGHFRGGLNSSNFVASDFRLQCKNVSSATRFGDLGEPETRSLNIWLAAALYGNLARAGTTPIIYALEHVYLNFVWEGGVLRKVIMDKTAPQTQ